MDQLMNDTLLDYIQQAAFYVRDGIIVQVNHAAHQKGIMPGDPISTLLGNNEAMYQQFQGGSFYLTLQIYQLACGACVTRTEEADIFLLDEDFSTSLQVLALSAQQLRMPLQDAFAIAEALHHEPRQQKIAQELSRRLYQMHRIICNMADTFRYNELTDVYLEPTDITDVFRQVMEKSAQALYGTGIRLLYNGLMETVIGLAAPELLERAIYNLISNAVKFSTAPSIIQTELYRNGNQLRFTMTDQGCGIGPDVLGNLFSRYLRGPGVEESRQGIGLGLALVRAAAVIHGGTVLIDQPGQTGIRVTLTLTIRQDDPLVLRSPVQFPKNDYAGGYDHTLTELADVLPAKTYKQR